MKVVERYIFRRAFVIFIATLVVTLAIVWTTQALIRIDLVTSTGASAATFLKVATLLLPSIVPEVVPFAIAIAVAQTLSAMNTDSELVVVNAAGSPASAVVRPILLVALIGSLFSLAFTNWIDPYAKLSYRDIIARARSDFVSIVLQEGTFRQVEPGLFLQIGAQLPGGELSEIFVADSRTAGIDLVYYAKTGAVVKRGDQSVLLMSDGEVQRKSTEGELSVIHFQSYAFDLSTFAAASSSPKLPKDRFPSELYTPDPNDIVFLQIPQILRSEIHRRQADWAYSIVFALIALAIAGNPRSHREARVHPLITTIAIALLVRGIGHFATNQLNTKPLFAILLYGAPAAAALVSCWFIATHRTMELPVAFAENLLGALRRLGDRLTFLRRTRQEPA